MQDLILVGAGLVNARHDTTQHDTTQAAQPHQPMTLGSYHLGPTDTVTTISDYHVTVT